MSSVMVTGGAGLIGANLVRALHPAGDDVRVLDDLSAGRPKYLGDVPVEVMRGSTLNTSLVREAARGIDAVDAVVPLAALFWVAPSLARPERDFDLNVRGTFKVLEAARRRGVPSVVFASSGAVLAGARPPLDEELVSPRSPDGASKAYGAVALQTFGAVYDITDVMRHVSGSAHAAARRYALNRRSNSNKVRGL